MFPAYGSSNPWRSRSQPPPVQRRQGRAPPPASSNASPAAEQPSRASQPGQQPHEQQQQPVDERTQRLQQLDQLALRFAELQRNFSPPSATQLSFQPKASLTAPKLEYNPTNAPVHAYEEGLTRLLTELDGVESGGDAKVRTTRKALASRVEGEAQRVERWRKEIFEARQSGGQGPEWQKAAPLQDDISPAVTTATGSSASARTSAEVSGRATPASAQRSDGASAAEPDEPETPVDEVVYHVQPDAARKDASPAKGHPHRSQRGEPTANHSDQAAPSSARHPSSQHQKQSGHFPMCRAEDGDEEEPLTSADERELDGGGRSQAPFRSRHPSAPSQARPHVPHLGPPVVRDQPSRSPDRAARRAEPPLQQRRAPVDPFEVLLGGGARSSGSPDLHTAQPDRRGRGGRADEDAVVYDEDGVPYFMDPRTGTYYPAAQQSRSVPWYAHGYPRERDLGGYQDARRSRGGGRGGRGGHGWMTPESDYLFGGGRRPMGGWGW
ncbi:hypothetical protein JCM10908_003141 [Rhodotorula pacifica]|uniref:uncharacterized protein n=1 Tax=Rhodotorula pacifica TaxID=1495444 RepID=UPI00317174CA